MADESPPTSLPLAPSPPTSHRLHGAASSSSAPPPPSLETPTPTSPLNPVTALFRSGEAAETQGWLRFSPAPFPSSSSDDESPPTGPPSYLDAAKGKAILVEPPRSSSRPWAATANPPSGGFMADARRPLRCRPASPPASLHPTPPPRPASRQPSPPLLCRRGGMGGGGGSSRGREGRADRDSSTQKKFNSALRPGKETEVRAIGLRCLPPQRRLFVRASNPKMSSSPTEALALAVKEMELHAAEVRQIVARNLAVPEAQQTVQDLREVLINISDWLDTVAVQCSEVVEITEEDIRVAAEMHTEGSPPTPRPLWELCEEWGVDYDSDQSQGI